MRTDGHYERLRESLEVIEECISKGIVKRQRTIGNCSAAASDMIEILLHDENLIDPGFSVKHEWFASKNKINDKLPFEFKEKRSILPLMEAIERKRNDLSYGMPKEEAEIIELLKYFNEVKQIFNKCGVKID